MDEYDLSNNSIGNDGAAELVDKGLFHAKDTLTLLNIAQNNIGDSGCRAILNFVLECKKFKQLLLNYNDLSDETIKIFTEQGYDIGTRLSYYEPTSDVQDDSVLSGQEGFESHSDE